MIKAIFFDLDGTIRYNEPRGTDVFADHAAQLGQRIRDDDRLRAMRWEHYYWALSQELDEDYKTYGHLTDDFWRRYAHRQLVALGASKAQADELSPKMHAYMTESYRPANVVPAELPGVLQSLKDAGHTLGVISNREHPFGDELDELGLAPFFSLTLASGEFNTWKPEPQIFLHACEQLSLQPDEAVYVGDNWFADVVGAKNAGVTPVLYDPRGIFDDPECDVIKSFTELPRTLRLNGRA